MTVNREHPATNKTIAANNTISQIEVFCTNVIYPEDANKLLQLCATHFPGCACNFDLEDCDKIFRIRSQEDISAAVISLFHQYHFKCDILI